MLLGVFLIALIFIILLATLPFLFKLIFKTKNYMGYSIGICSSIFTIVTIFGVFVIGLFFFIAFFNRASDKAFTIGAIILIIIFVILYNIVIFLFIFNYAKGISNPNQPYNCVFMFIAGYLLPLFTLIYLYFILVSLEDKNGEIRNYYLSRLKDVTPLILILHEVFFLFNMIQLAGIIMLSMLHHRKVNKYIFYILMGCYITPNLSYLIEFFFGNKYLLIPNVIINIAPLGFGIFFYCKYANHEYPNSEFLDPINY